MLDGAGFVRHAVVAADGNMMSLVYSRNLSWRNQLEGLSLVWRVDAGHEVTLHQELTVPGLRSRQTVDPPP